MRLSVLFLAAAAVCMFIPHTFIFAQSTDGVALISTPPYPERGEAYELTLKTNTRIERSNITWFVDGKEALDFKNSTTLTIPEGEAPANITARLVAQNGAVYERTYVRNPYRVDIIVEADTTTPLFYKGRSLPSSGSTVKLTALAFRDRMPVSGNLSYLWKINGTTQNGGALLGKNSITYTPNFENEISVSVDIINSQGAVIMNETVVIPVVKPELYFYELNPLRGLSTIAMRNPYIFVGQETTVRAEPYYVNSNLFDKNPHTEWLINGQKVETTSAEANEITLRKEGEQGSIELFFQIRNMQQLLQGVKDSITIRF